MNIGDASRRADLPPKTIRYYEDIGLVVPERNSNGYRNFDERTVHKLRFVQRARSLGFGIDDCRELLSLFEHQSRASADVRVIAEAKLSDIDRKIVELGQIRATLAHLIEACRGDSRPDCPILDELAGDGEPRILAAHGRE